MPPSVSLIHFPGRRIELRRSGYKVVLRGNESEQAWLKTKRTSALKADEEHF